MEYTVLLDKNSNIREIETEEQTRFVLSVIEALEIPFEWDANKSFTVFDKVRLRKTLGQYNISIVDDMEGGLKIYLEHQIVADWKKPFFILKEDLTEIDPRKKLYIEMRCSFSSIFEEQEETVE